MDPSMLAGMSDMFKNPDMMKSMEEMMKNPEIMNSAMNMMNDPNMMNMFGGLGNMGGQHQSEDGTPENNQESQDNEESNNEETIEGSVDVEENTEFSEGDYVIIAGLKNDTYNNKNGVVRMYNSSTGRYNIFIESLDKVIALKPENLLPTTDNIDVELVD
jgi:hypothetical protein